MASITDIKKRITELAPAPFQEFCDTLISKQGVGVLHGFGMKSGTGNTTTGNPDTYFRTEDGKYVFVAYTIQQSNIYSKLKEDIEKCLDPSKTGVDIKNIKEIICCHTSSNLSAGDDKKLHDFCENQGVVLTIWGLDEIANQVHNRYRSLAKDYLGLSIDTNQIFAVDDFIAQYDANVMSAPLNTVFQYRENEKREIIQGLENNNVVIVTGKAGVGKTRLVLEASKEVSQTYGYKLLCVKNNNLGLYEDLVSATEQPYRYLFFIDDANELAELDQILAYTTKAHLGYIVKIIVTVRDYAKASVITSVRKYSVPRIIEIKPFSDEEMKGFLNDNLDIRNDTYIKQITRIAEGNPRIAYMAGRLAVEEQNLSSIKDVSQLYEAYYEKYVNEALGNDSNLCFVAGILSVINAVVLSNMSALQELLDNFGITCDVFKEEILKLASLEVVEIHLDQVAMLSDQCLANYMLYYVFFQKRLAPFSQVLEIGYKHFRNGVIRSIDTIFNIYDSEETKLYFEQEILKAWDALKNGQYAIYEDFVKDFHVFRPEEAFLLVDKKINNIEQKEFDARNVDFNKNVFLHEESILPYLAGYENRDYLDYVLELLYAYASKTEETLVSAVNWLKNTYGIGVNDYKYKYYTQRIISEHLLNAVSNGDAVTLAIGLQWAKYVLGFSFHASEIGRGNKLLLYNLEIKNSDGIKSVRQACWDILLTITAKNECKDNAIMVLDEYSRQINENTDRGIVADDIVKIQQLLPALSSDRISFLVVVERLLVKCSRLSIEFDEKWSDILSGKKWDLYKLLENDFISSGLEYEEYINKREQRIREYGENLEINEIQEFVQNANGVLSDPMIKRGYYEINHGIELIIQRFDETQMMEFTRAFIELGPELSVNPVPVFEKLSSSFDPETLWNFINDAAFPQKNEWLFAFFVSLPSENANKEMYEALIQFLRSDTDKTLSASPYRRLRVLDKFLPLEPNIYPIACSIIYEKRKYSEFIVRIYFESMFHEQIYSPQELISLFNSDTDLLQDIYFFMQKRDTLADLNGFFLIEFLAIDESWLQKYSNVFWEHVIKHKGYDNNKCNTLWKSDHYKEYFDYIFYHYPEEVWYRWRISSAFKDLLAHIGNNTVIAAHQQEWLTSLITDNAFSDKITVIFEIVCELSDDVRRNALQTFLDINSDFDVFKEIDIVPNHWFGSGSLVPAYQRQVEFLESLYPLVPGIKYLKHRNLIKEKIESLREMIKREEVDEIYRNLYM